MKTFFRWKNSKFPTFKLYTVSEKRLYHQRYSSDFQKLSFRWIMWKIGIRISHFQAVHCVRKNAISPKVFKRFSKTFLLLEDVENRYLAQKFHWRSYFSFAMVRWKLLQKENLKFPNSKQHTVPEKMLYHQRYSTDFQKLFFCWKMWKIGIWAENFIGAAILVFQW